MAVPQQQPYVTYQANGIATVYAIPFKLLRTSDLDVQLDGAPVTTGFVISGLGNDTSTITFSTALSGRLLLLRDVPLERVTDYQTNGDLLAKTLNLDLDRIWMAIQGFFSQQVSAVRAPFPETLTSLPPAIERVGMLISFDSNGNPSVVAPESGSAVELAILLSDGSSLLNGASRVARSTIAVNSLSELATLRRDRNLVANLVLGGRSGFFFFESDDYSAQVTADPLQGVYVAPASDPSGASGAWVRQDGQAIISSRGLRIGWFGAVGDGVTNDAAAIQAAYDLAATTRFGRVEFGYGRFAMSETVLLDKSSCSFVGFEDGFRQTGFSAQTGSVLIWTGGSAPMFSQSVVGIGFKGFSAYNTGLATDFLEMNSGAQNNVFEDLYFYPPSIMQRFSRSIIRS
ncbi:hypothetical protein N5D41_11535, partial [Pseudomonas toyotomiensis]